MSCLFSFFRHVRKVVQLTVITELIPGGAPDLEFLNLTNIYTIRVLYLML